MIDRLEAIQQEQGLKRVADMVSCKYMQIDNEEEFIKAIAPEVSDTYTATLLWHSLNEMYKNCLPPSAAESN